MDKDEKRYIEENRVYSFDFSEAVSVRVLHEKYQGLGLSDVDYIVETPDRILCGGESVEKAHRAVPDHDDSGIQSKPRASF